MQLRARACVDARSATSNGPVVTERRCNTSAIASAMADTSGQIKLTGVNIDDWFFGVSAIGADGFVLNRENPQGFVRVRAVPE